MQPVQGGNVAALLCLVLCVKGMEAELGVIVVVPLKLALEALQ